MNTRHLSIIRLVLLTGAVAVTAFFAQNLHAENWPQWRGPFFNGSTTETNLPDHWSKTENVAWVAPLPGKGGSTPAIWGDSIFVTTSDQDRNLALLCLNSADGKARWQKMVAEGDRDAAKNNMASPSPVTDGKTVVAVFGTGDMAAFDFSGKELWKRSLAEEFGHIAIMFYYSSSPLLYHGKLYVQVVQRNPPSAYSHAIDLKPARESFLLCVDATTGKTLWRQIRDTDAVGESMDAYTSPTLYQGAHGPEIIVFGAGYVTSHNPETGEELWRCGSLNPTHTGMWRTIASPVTGPGFVYVCVPRPKSPLVAIKADTAGQPSGAQIAWRFTGNSSDVPTPLYYQGKLFVLDGNKQVMTCLDPATGEMKWQGNLAVREIFSASPTGADGKIYGISDAGTVVVLSAGDEFKIVSSFKMEGEGESAALAPNGVPIPSSSPASAPIVSPIVAAAGRLFVRTAQSLYCIGKK
jgi:outer membrane protein assembly factor BamB